MSTAASGRGGGVAAVILAAGSSSRLGTPKQLLRYRGETLVHRAVRLAIAAGLDPVHVVLGYNAPAVGEALAELRGQVTTVVNADWQAGMGSSLARGIASLPAGTGPVSAPRREGSPAGGPALGTDAGKAPSADRAAEAGAVDGGRAPGAASPEPGTGAAPRCAPGVRAQSYPARGAATGSAPGAALVLVTDQPRLSRALLAEIAAAFRTGGAPLVASRYASGALGVPALFARRYFPELRRLTGDRGARALFTRHRDDLVTIAFPEGDLDIDTPAAAATLALE